MTDFFSDAEIIYAYTDADALADGVVRDSSAWLLFHGKTIINRITETAIDKIRAHFKLNRENGICEKIGELIETVRADGEDLIIDYPFKLWLLPNETGGLTLMLPSDY